jgi:4-deoxy-L-threo-5-hexosulose-uronate ketol-isomerase
MSIKYEIRDAAHMTDVKHYDTERLRKQFLIEKIFFDDEINMVYSMYDRVIIGGAFPVHNSLALETIDPVKADYFLHRREIGIFNIGGRGRVKIDGRIFDLEYKDALYLGSGDRQLSFESLDPITPARFYFNSAPAHKPLADRKIALAEAENADLGRANTANIRRVNKMIISNIVDTCQLQMGLTELKSGSVWNTMPAHTHARRMEVYFYFEVPKNQAICHFMGEPEQTRHLWLSNEQAVISPSWSIHSAAGTSNYNFIWGMAGENQDYSDMDLAEPEELR